MTLVFDFAPESVAVEEDVVAPTPYLRLDGGAVVDRYRELQAAFPATGIHYAVKANPHPELLAALAGAGCQFDVAGAAEAAACLKAGASADDLLHSNPVAHRRGLDVAGVAFHVGSQQRQPQRWEAPIADAAAVFRALERRGMRPRLLDIGGGLPAGLDGETPPLAAYGQAIAAHVRTHFGPARPRLLMEPGRSVVGDAGELVSPVIAVVQRAGRRWVYLDAGVFTGLLETLDEAIRYRLVTSADGGPTGPAVLAGPTCDSADVLYERTPAELPLALAEGDVVRFQAAGASTTCYSTVGFNGFAPLPTYVVCR